MSKVLMDNFCCVLESFFIRSYSMLLKWTSYIYIYLDGKACKQSHLDLSLRTDPSTCLSIMSFISLSIYCNGLIGGNYLIDNVFPRNLVMLNS